MFAIGVRRGTSAMLSYEAGTGEMMTNDILFCAMSL